MKKKLEAELISIAHRILQIKDKSDVFQLQEEARQLYEKLTILSFSESHFSGPQPTIGQVKAALEENESEKLKEVKKKIKEIITPEPPIKLEEKPKVEIPEEPQIKLEEKVDKTSNVENKPELIIEEINARVTEDLFVPASTGADENTSFSESLVSESIYEKTDKEDNTSRSQIISIVNKEDHDEKPKSLNDQLRKDIHIGLNDRLAFIKYLFDGSAPDYNRVLSQLSTLRSKNEVSEFIKNMVKPDYDNWDGKDEYEERFMHIVTSKFEH